MNIGVVIGATPAVLPCTVRAVLDLGVLDWGVLGFGLMLLVLMAGLSETLIAETAEKGAGR